VWAANPPGPNVSATRQGGTWVLRDTKQYCSGPRVCTHALVAADEIDADPVTCAVGAGPLSHDEAHSRAVADLTVYLRQHHAEGDLARLGELVAEQGATW
jgi:hypothetical protein